MSVDAFREKFERQLKICYVQQVKLFVVKVSRCLLFVVHHECITYLTVKERTAEKSRRGNTRTFKHVTLGNFDIH